MNSASTFSLSPAPLGLDDCVVDIWRADLEVHPLELNRLQNYLSTDELDRAARFHFARDRRRFIVARAILRDILARYLDQPPAELQFSYSAHGKPSLARNWDSACLRFNISHASSVAVYGISCNREVGIDIERIEPKWAVWEIADKFFTPNETATLRSLPANLLSEAFFNCWTRKEAYVKARGTGLQTALNSFEVSLAPGEQATFLSEGESGWSLKALPIDRGYVAAIAVEGHDWRPRFLKWRIRPDTTRKASRAQTSVPRLLTRKEALLDDAEAAKIISRE
ncbi:MAG: 4'-phosphopantetheinyl transferase superfamily protein [Candidatus Acidiferrales bacterium]